MCEIGNALQKVHTDYVKSLYLDAIQRETALYSPLDIQYQNEYSGSYEDKSCVSDDGIVIAAVKDGVLSGFGRPVMIEGEKDWVIKQVQGLLQTTKGIRLLDYVGGGQIGVAAKYLLQQGASATPYFCHKIDLQYADVSLWADVRKSFKSLINQPEYQIECDFNCGGEYVSTGKHIPLIKKLHEEVHKRQTRSDKTWDIQRQMVVNGQAFTLIGTKEGKVVCGDIFYLNDHVCYYACGVSLPHTSTHAMIWQAVKLARLMQCKTFDFGQIFFSALGNDYNGYLVSDKMVNISNFKRGFGGETKCYLLVEL